MLQIFERRVKASVFRLPVASRRWRHPAGFAAHRGDFQIRMQGTTGRLAPVSWHHGKPAADFSGRIIQREFSPIAAIRAAHRHLKSLTVTIASGIGNATILGGASHPCSARNASIAHVPATWMSSQSANGAISRGRRSNA